MKTLVLTALLAAVAYGAFSNENLDNQPQWPWQPNKLYRYDVQSHNWAQLPEGATSGNAFQATFIIRMKDNGQLFARLENPQHAQFHQELQRNQKYPLPEDLKFEAVKGLDVVFEIKLEGGRVMALAMPSTLSLAHENLLKGLISTLQVDLSTYSTAHSTKNYYDQESHQGQFKKMETDVTGECETLYTVSPAASEWRRELTMPLTEDPIMITKSKDFGHCHHRVSYHFGVPDVAEWRGTADNAQKEQFIDRAANTRILAGKQGPIYKAETTNTIFVHPYMYGQQKAEVQSYMKLNLVAFEEDKEPAWEVGKGARVSNLLYAMTSKQMPVRDISEESEENNQDNSGRLSESLEKIASFTKNLLRRNSQYENEENSSSDSKSAYVNEESLNSNEPAYAGLYMAPQTHKANKQNPANAQKLVQELAQLLQRASNMPKSDFLSKFNILVRVIAAMDSEQLTQTSQSIESAKSSNNAVKADMWMIYRDAVAQAGTQPAFKQIVSWIQNKHIRGEEAAQVVATLANTLRYPTKKVMMQFFELALNPEVTKEQYLNSTILIAATKFINMGQVNNVTAHSYYPTHMYGRLARKHDNFVVEEVLPRLRQGLEQAIQQEDSRNAQVYIKAIGNLGHRDVLAVFAPYLEGKIPASTYLRALMVDNLVILAHEKDSYTRAVLFSILKNPAEPYEVRLAAIQNIFVAHPTTAMMQDMAQMTHDDISTQVRAAIKYAIRSAAEQKNPHHLNLARTAQAALPKLTQERFGSQYSSKLYSDYFDSEYELGIMGDYSTIGSEDSMFPKYLRYSRWSQTNGWDSISASLSNVRRLVELFKQQTNGMWQQASGNQQQPNHKYSASKISEMLNMKRNPQNPLEAALYVGLWNQQRYYTFSEQDLKEMPNAIKELFGKLSATGVHYTKVFNQAQISVMFPLSSGMPFIYKYKEPTVVHIQAKVNGQSKFDRTAQSAGVNGEIQFTYARNIDGSVGFLNTLSNYVSSVGYVNKVQLNIPVKADFQMNRGEIKLHLQQLRPEQDNLMVHYSVWPYTTIQKKDTLVPISLDPATKPITRANKVISLKDTTQSYLPRYRRYQVEGYSYSSDYRNVMKNFQSSNLFTNLIKAVYQKDVASTHFNLKYQGNKEPDNGVTLTAAYDDSYNQKENSEVPLAANKMEDTSPNSPARRAEMAKRVASGINSARAQVIDFSAIFGSDAYVLTAAIANSPVDPKIHYAFFAGSNAGRGNQINAVGKVFKPEGIALNPQQALEKEQKMNFEIDVKFGEQNNNNIRIQGNAERSKKYAEALKNLCADQMKRHNYYHDACQDIVIMAQAPDQWKMSVNFNAVEPNVKKTLLRAYKIVEQHNQWYSEAMTPELINGQFNINIENNYLDNVMKVSLGSQEILKNVPIPRVSALALSTYQPIRAYERVANYYTSHLYQPFCVVNGNNVRTFSGRNYNYALSPEWHVVMQDAPKQYQWQDELVVLAKKPTEQQQHIYISYQSETGQDLEIEIEPTGNKPNVNVKTNSKKVSEGDLTMYLDEAEQKPFLQYHNLPDGVLMLNIREDRLRVMYDGRRIVVLAKDGRNTVRGLCGVMNGDTRDDYWTPQGLVDSDEQLGASYALVEGNDEKTQQLQAQAQQKAYQREYKYTNILKADSQWQKWQSNDESEGYWDNWNSQKIYRTRSHLKQPRGNCVRSKQVQYYETNTEICITTAPLEGCSSHCKGEGYKVQKAQVVCNAKTDVKFQEYVKEINQGKSPVVSGTPKNTQPRQYRVPASCRA